jgi:hypothetical protein
MLYSQRLVRQRVWGDCINMRLFIDRNLFIDRRLSDL